MEPEWLESCEQRTKRPFRVGFTDWPVATEWHLGQLVDVEVATMGEDMESPAEFPRKGAGVLEIHDAVGSGGGCEPRRGDFESGRSR